MCVDTRRRYNTSLQQLLDQIPDAEGGATVDTVVGGLLGIGKPAPTTRCLEAKLVSYHALAAGTCRQHLFP